MTEKKRRKVGNYALLLGTLHRNKKVQRLSDRAFRAYINALSFSADQLSDGKVPLVSIPPFMPRAQPAAQKKAIAELLKRDTDDCAFWYRISPDEIEIHDYLEINASRAEIQAKRKEQSRRAKARWEAGRNAAVDAGGIDAGMPAVMPAASRRRSKKVISHDAGGNAGGNAGGDAKRDPSPCPLVPSIVNRSTSLVTAGIARGTNGDAVDHVEDLSPELAARYAEAQRKIAEARASRSREGETSDFNPPRVKGPKLVPPDDGAADG